MTRDAKARQGPNRGSAISTVAGSVKERWLAGNVKAVKSGSNASVWSAVETFDHHTFTTSLIDLSPNVN